MYRKIVVPLDGSKLAEIALPHLEQIAKGCEMPQVLLVSVTKAVKGKISGIQAGEYTTGGEYRMPHLLSGTVHSGLIYSEDSAHMREVQVTLGRMTKAALNYLRKISQQLEDKGLNTQVNVLVGNPAEEIARFVQEQGADLIVMASHGRGGGIRLTSGTVAEKVIHATHVPVMLVKPEPGFKETKSRRKGTPS